MHAGKYSRVPPALSLTATKGCGTGTNSRTTSIPEYEITVVFSGNGQRVTNDFTEPFREGEVVVLPPYFPHGWVYDKALCAPDGMIENGSLQFGEEFLVQLSQLSPEFQPVVRFIRSCARRSGSLAKRRSGCVITGGS